MTVVLATQGPAVMAASRGHMLLLALAAVVLHHAAGQSTTQCPVGNDVYSGAPFSTVQQQVVQWCRFAEQGAHSSVDKKKTLGTRFWGGYSQPDGSLFDTTGTVPALTLKGVGEPFSVAGETFNSTCAGSGGAFRGALDGTGQQSYGAASLACATNDALQYSPTRCPVSCIAHTLIRVVPAHRQVVAPCYDSEHLDL